MADTGEKRQIVVRANANEAEKVRESKKLISEERAKEKVSDAVFAGNAKRSGPRSNLSKQRSSPPNTSKA